MLELLALTALGVLIGALTGSIPGLHPNTIVFSSFPIYFSTPIGLPTYIAFVAGLSVSHTFHDFLPAIYLSAPSSESAVASIPGAQMVKNGDGKTAFYYTVTGGIFAVTAVTVLSPLFFYLLAPLYNFLSGFMAYLLGFFLLFIIFENWKISALTVTALSGAIGIIAFRMPVNQNFILMPVFSGLFAVPAALDVFISDFNIPEQADVEKEVSWRGGLIGFISGLIAGTVPGVGAGAATSFLSPLIEDRKEVLTGLGAVNTSDIFVSFIALFVIEKARSGASVAIQTLGDLSVPLFMTAVGSSLLAVGLSLPLTARTEKVFLKGVRFFDLDNVLLSVLLIILALTVYFTGFRGVLVLVTSSLVGSLAWFKDCRTCAMSVLIVPALVFYLGVGIFI